MKTAKVAQIIVTLKSGTERTFHLEASNGAAPEEGIRQLFSKISEMEWLHFIDPITRDNIFIRMEEIAFAKGGVMTFAQPETEE